MLDFGCIIFSFILQSIGYANLAKMDPQYGLCKSCNNQTSLILTYTNFYFYFIKINVFM